MEENVNIESLILERYSIDEINYIISKTITYIGDDIFKEYKDSTVDIIIFNKLRYLVQAMENLKDSKGIEQHIKEYKNDFDSSFLVSVIANKIKLSGFEVILEPNIEDNDKKPDLCFEYNGIDVFIECKNPKQNLNSFINHQLHEKVFDTLYGHINVPCDLTIEYLEEEKLNDMDGICDFMDKYLVSIKEEGVFYLYKGIKISVTDIREEFINRYDCSFSFMIEDYYSNGFFPMEIICKNNKSIGFIKKDIFKIRERIIINQMKMASKKVKKNQALILVIDGSNLPGTRVDNNEYISSLFKPNKFTSFSGILLLYSNFGIEDEPSFSSQFISNPYSKNPIKNISNEFRLNIFKTN